MFDYHVPATKREAQSVWISHLGFHSFMSRFHDCMIVQLQSLDYAVVNKYGTRYKHIIKLKHHSNSIGQKSMHESNMFFKPLIKSKLMKFF